MGSKRAQRAARTRQKETGEKYVDALRAVREELEREKEERLRAVPTETADQPVTPDHCVHCQDPEDPHHNDPEYARAEAECAFYENPVHLMVDGSG